MHGLVEHEVSRQRREDIRREVMAYRLQSELRAGRSEEPRSLENPGWKPARYAVLLIKCLRGPGGTDYQVAAKNGGGPVN